MMEERDHADMQICDCFEYVIISFIDKTHSYNEVQNKYETRKRRVLKLRIR